MITTETCGRLTSTSLAAEVSKQLGLFVRLAAVLGARGGELCGLRWEDIDFDARTLTIRTGIADVAGRLMETDTKSHKPRTIALDADTTRRLRQQRRWARSSGSSRKARSTRGGHGYGHSVPRLSVIDTVDQLRVVWPDLTGVALVGVDLRHEQFDWSAATLKSTVFAACTLPDGAGDLVMERGAVLLSRFGALPFEPYRSTLYSYDALITGCSDGTAATLDSCIGAWFTASSTALHDAVARALHDATIDAAVARYVIGRRVVGVMGGHAVGRDEDLYQRVAQLGRALTRGGYTVATGGGPGVMEAANLGAWMAPAADRDLDAALAILASAPSFTSDCDGYVETAMAVRTQWNNAGESLGVPTWLYVDEPTSGFATHIAKYFTNSIREDGLLAIARSGVVYAPGGAGTQQEIFTDTAQNSLTLHEVRSPMVFLGRPFFEAEHAELLTAVRRQAAAFGWDELVTVVDSTDDALTFITSHDPDTSGHVGVERRRAHQDV